MIPLHYYLLVSALLFCIGLTGVLVRRNAIMVLIGVELMLNAANLNFIAFWRYLPEPQAARGILFVLFSIGLAAAEASVGLALIIAMFRKFKGTEVERLDQLKG